MYMYFLHRFSVLGISYRSRNPVAYTEFEEGCSASPDHMIRYDGFNDDVTTTFLFSFDNNTFACKRFRLQAVIDATGTLPY